MSVVSETFGVPVKSRRWQRVIALSAMVGLVGSILVATASSVPVSATEDPPICAFNAEAVPANQPKVLKDASGVPVRDERRRYTFLVSTVEQLAWIGGLHQEWAATFGNSSARDALENKVEVRTKQNIRILNPIDFGGCGWRPIGQRPTSDTNASSQNALSFAGHFDGGSHTLSNFHVLNQNDHRGLFSKVARGASFTDVVISNISAVGGQNHLGSLWGDTTTNSRTVDDNAERLETIDGVDIQPSSWGLDSGPIMIIDTTVTGINFDLESANPVGGVIGRIGSISVTLTNLRASGEIRTTGNTPGVGGLVGLLSGTSAETVVRGSSFDGFVRGGRGVGGLVGRAEAGIAVVDQSLFVGTVESYGGSSNEGADVGGLIGRAQARELTISYSAARGNVSGANANTNGNVSAGSLVGRFVGRSTSGIPNASLDIFDSYAIASVSADSTRDRSEGEVAGLAAAGGVVGSFGGKSRPDTEFTMEQTFFAAETTSGREVVDVGVGPFWAVGREFTSSEEETYTEVATASFSASFWDSTLFGRDVAGALVEQQAAFGRPSSELKSFDTFDAAGWAIVDGWAPFSTNPTVWGICSGVNDGYPFLLWEYTSNPCVTAPAGAATPPEKRAGSPAIHLDLQASVGDAVSGAPVVIGGQGLAGRSEYTLVVRSTPQTIDSGQATALGNFSKRVTMPALAPGSHTLTLTATAPDGSTLALVQSFTVGADGTFTAIGSPVGSQSGGLAATGVSGIAGGVGLAALVVLLGLAMVVTARRYQTTQ